MTIQAQKLRALIDSGKPFIAADAYSAATGRVVEQVGFPAAYLGGHACSAFHYALPDYGMFSQVEQIDQASRIVAAVDIPLIVDADQLGETTADAFHFTRRHERAGIAGFHVEDEVNPKHSSYSNGLLPIAEMQAKIEACTKAREDPAFVIRVVRAQVADVGIVVRHADRQACGAHGLAPEVAQCGPRLVRGHPAPERRSGRNRLGRRRAG